MYLVWGLVKWCLGQIEHTLYSFVLQWLQFYAWSFEQSLLFKWHYYVQHIKPGMRPWLQVSRLQVSWINCFQSVSSSFVLWEGALLFVLFCLSSVLNCLLISNRFPCLYKALWIALCKAGAIQINLPHLEYKNVIHASRWELQLLD